MIQVGRKPATLMKVARGEKAADLVLKNASVIDVFRKKIFVGHVAVHSGYIVGFGSYRGRRIINLEGKFLTPGLIDGHTHIESTFLSPQEFGRLCLTSGVTAVVADPHEIANVFGMPGIRWMIEMAPHSPIRMFFACPSCVPSSPLETPGGTISLMDMEKLKGRKEIIALGEMMDYQGLIRGSRDIIRKISLFEGYPLEGHAPGLRGDNLAAYRVSGVSSDHETEDPDEAEEKLSYGFHVMVREGSVAKNLESLLPFLNTYQDSGSVSIVSDDMSILDMAKKNYLGRVLSKGVKKGIDPVNIIRMATVNTARRFNFIDIGAIAPGYLADMVVYENLMDFEPFMVFMGGEIRYRRGKPVKRVKAPQIPGKGGVCLPSELSPEKFRVKRRGKSLKVISVTPGSLNNVIESVRVGAMKGGYIPSLPSRDLIKVCVIERHRGSGRMGKGFVRGLRIKSGALGLTFAHDAHNLVVAGTEDEGMYEVVRMISRIGGGIAAVGGKGKKVVIPLKIGGIISNKGWEEVAAKMEKVKKVCESISPLGVDLINILSFIALPVIPEGRITDKGFIDVRVFRRVSIWD